MEVLLTAGLIVLTLLSLTLAGMAMALWFRGRRMTKALADLEARLGEVQAEAETLRPFADVRDATAEARRLRSEADVYSTMKRAEADSYHRGRTQSADAEATRVTGAGSWCTAPVDVDVEFRDGAAPAPAPDRRAEDGRQDEEQGQPEVQDEVPRAELGGLRAVSAMSG